MQDSIGSNRQVCDAAGSIVRSVSFDSFGQSSESLGTIDNDFQYANYYKHERSSFYLATNRAYSASLSRWMNRDPIAERGGINLFKYVNNSPTNFSDPSGLSGVGAAAGAFIETSTEAGAEVGAIAGSSFGPEGTLTGAGIGAVTGFVISVTITGAIIYAAIKDSQKPKPYEIGPHNKCPEYEDCLKGDLDCCDQNYFRCLHRCQYSFGSWRPAGGRHMGMLKRCRQLCKAYHSECMGSDFFPGSQFDNAWNATWQDVE